MNEYDSGKIADIAKAAAGYEVTDDINEADLVVFNTCSIREKAQEKVFSDLGRVRELKKTKPNLKIAVGGCVASQEGGNIVRRGSLRRCGFRAADSSSPAGAPGKK